LSNVYNQQMVTFYVLMVPGIRNNNISNSNVVVQRGSKAYCYELSDCCFKQSVPNYYCYTVI